MLADTCLYEVELACCTRAAGRIAARPTVQSEILVALESCFPDLPVVVEVDSEKDSKMESQVLQTAIVEFHSQLAVAWWQIFVVSILSLPKGYCLPSSPLAAASCPPLIH